MPEVPIETDAQRRMRLAAQARRSPSAARIHSTTAAFERASADPFEGEPTMTMQQRARSAQFGTDVSDVPVTKPPLDPFEETEFNRFVVKPLNTASRTAGTTLNFLATGLAEGTSLPEPGPDGNLRSTTGIRPVEPMIEAFRQEQGRDPDFNETLSLVQDALNTPPGFQGLSEVIADIALPPFGAIPVEKWATQAVREAAPRVGEAAARGARAFVGDEVGAVGRNVRGAGDEAVPPVAAAVEPGPPPPATPAAAAPDAGPRTPRFDAGPRAVTMADRGGTGGPPRPPRDLPPAPDEGLPSGRRPGGPQNEVPQPPPPTPLVKLRTVFGGEQDPLIDRVVQAIPREIYDRNFPLRAVQDAVPEKQARWLAQIVPGAQAEADDVLRRTWVPAVKAVGDDYDRLKEYMTARRFLEVRGRQPEAMLPGGIDRTAELSTAMEQLRREVGDARFANIEEAARQLWAADRHELELLRAEGILSQRQFTEIVANNQNYIPLVRDDYVSAAAEQGRRYTRPEASVSSSGIRNLSDTGSTKNLVDDPLNALLQVPARTRATIARNRAARGIVESLQAIDTATGGDAMVKIVKEGGENSSTRGTISFFRDGERVTAEVPAVFARLAKNLDAESSTLLLRIWRGLTAPLRHGAITFNPAYTPIAVARDAMSAAFRENVFPLGPDWIAGMWGALTKNDLFSDTARIGGLMGSITEQMTKRRALDIDTRIPLGAIPLKSPTDALLLIPRLVREMNIIAEQGGRLAVNRKLAREGVDAVERAVRVRDATVDFSKMGNAMQVINTIIPFSNAALQGNANILRTTIAHPKRAMAFATAMATPTVLTRINNMQYETSKDIPYYEYTRSWVVQTGEGTRADGTKYPIYFKFPKGEIAGAMTFPVEAIFHLFNETEDRTAVELLFESAMEQAKTLSPIDPSIATLPGISTVASLQSNEDFFTGAPIIPEREQRLMPEQQFGPQTSSFAVALGQRTGVSPRLIEFAIEDYTAGVGQNTNWMLGMGLDALGFDREEFGTSMAEARPEGTERLSQTPGISRFLGTRDTQTERRGFDVLNEVTAETNRAFNQLPDVNRLGIALGSVNGTLTLSSGPFEMTPQQRAQLQQMTADEAIQRVERLMQRFAPGVSDTRRAERIREEVNDAREVARNRFTREVINPLLQAQRQAGPRQPGPGLQVGSGSQRQPGSGLRVISPGSNQTAPAIQTAPSGGGSGFDFTFDDEGRPTGVREVVR